VVSYSGGRSRWEKVGRRHSLSESGDLCKFLQPLLFSKVIRLRRRLAVVVPVHSLTLTTIMAAAVEEIRATSYVGFDSITQQIEHKLLKRGFQFNVIVVGTFFLNLPNFFCML